MARPHGWLWGDPSRKYFGPSVYYCHQSNSGYICGICIEFSLEILVKAKDYMTNICLKSTRLDNPY